ncbi:nucleoside recognition domain-containing protein [Clostridium estertheticum]|uniref:Spore maturation protein n=2 Tax=Clostridium estertheticum TaxID=238834 RepID=A0A1J0GCS0_9CLOT|nr:nucleoside recognition domain-containing protein [Clostridium estertheticum]APC38694.1 spore maturation protein [Clostridium estertheticum subsp. estertheticum]MBU3074702.1 spore maturation protein [Clostridium estertheticum]MBU3164586.1 spore maturation protein [Clostridium estertheticum]MBU3174226.1 spore maturation protein [Clostridium estertheticum]MBU3185508.1 spore maturation protein [Clostridium estertheticum]
MINIIWFLILSLGIVIGMLTGKGEIVSKSLVSSTTSSVELVMGLVGMMCLWCGIMKIAQKSGLTDKLAKVLRPILKMIFKETSKSNKVMSSITMNLTANMMGLSNAATPFGIKAMEEMQKMNIEKDTVSNDMALFLVLNATCIQFLPTTVISIRAAYNSQNPAIIIIPAIITTGVASVLGVVYCRILQKYF